MEPGLDGRVAIVTGANRAIGPAAALHLAQSGAHLGSGPAAGRFSISSGTESIQAVDGVLLAVSRVSGGLVSIDGGTLPDVA